MNDLLQLGKGHLNLPDSEGNRAFALPSTGEFSSPGLSPCSFKSDGILPFGIVVCLEKLKSENRNFYGAWPVNLLLGSYEAKQW